MAAAGVKKFGRDRHERAALGESLHTTIKTSKVLVVGAGGIGCELLKNLVCSGFGDIAVVDLDTIDLSNLNRQFLFRHDHIKQSKALIAKETASKFNPNVKITAHQANIKEKIFNVDWFKSFRIVFNALDNLDARRHVNRMCLAANIPLVESGTTGFEGQVQVIKKGSTECYDCNPKPIAKSFPVCTIRSTPSQPIHCIVWAKSYLFNEIFGVGGQEAAELDTTENSDNAEEISQLKQETRELKEIRDNMGNENFGQLVFNKVFDKDIERLRSADDMWKNRTPPAPMKWEVQAVAALGLEASEVANQDQAIWTEAQNIAVFLDSLARLSKRLKPLNGSGKSFSDDDLLSFDKDDKDTLDFVAAAANLRSIAFGIAPKSEFDIKQMAGNIIPAIATTNAMTASICVLEAFKILRDQIQKSKTVFLTPRNPARVVSAEPPHPPRQDCGVCSVANARLLINPERAKLSDLVEDILRKKLGYGEEISISSDSGLIFDPDLEDNLPRKLVEMGLSDGTTVLVVDDEEGEEISEGQYAGRRAPRVNLSLQVKAENADEEGPPVQILDDLVIERRPRKTIGESDPQITNGNGVDESGLKRKRDDNDGGADDSDRAKKAKNSSGDDILLVDGAPNDGAIVIGD